MTNKKTETTATKLESTLLLSRLLAKAHGRNVGTWTAEKLRAESSTDWPSGESQRKIGTLITFANVGRMESLSFRVLTLPHSLG